MSSSLERRIQAYLDPKQFAMFRGYCAREDMGESEAIKTIVKNFFNALPASRQQEYLKRARVELFHNPNF